MAIISSAVIGGCIVLLASLFLPDIARYFDGETVEKRVRLARKARRS